ncbi:MAG TPA: 2-(1,2-epoxy-1,2-dihydrophenyl)acetyl-CoA isomerase [Chloroflexi bacterium]|nr:2-(1,2-epoxy-1,2-dihydrophenyl)acetyl-CoA isomerase [Chloroflexota bacterium]
MEAYETLNVERHTAVLTVRLNRPKANAFSFTMVEELLTTLKRAGEDDGVRCIVLTGSGRFFSSGQDLAIVEETGIPVPFRYHLQRTYNRIVLEMRRLEKPIIGAINGTAAGAGLGIALATDIRWAAESARFVFGFTGIGLTADSGVSLTLPLLAGMARAAEFAFLNEPLSAHQALEWGVISRVLPDEELEDAVAELAQRLAAGPTRALGLTKRAFNHAVMPSLATVLDYEAHLQEIAGRTQDHLEGLNAFLGKRPPDFKGA